MDKMDVISLFSGAGGLDLGFEKAGFRIAWANEHDSSVWETYEFNFPGVVLDKRSIVNIGADEIPSADGIIGGPPCQAWSAAGAGRGLNDPRGQLFYDYIRILKAKQPKFFLVENVPGIVSVRHRQTFNSFLDDFEGAGYRVTYKLLNANDYGVPEDRNRVIIVGLRKDLGKEFVFPEPFDYKPTLRDAIGDLGEPLPAKEKNRTNGEALEIPNHEYFTGGFSSIYMSRNRVRGWDEPSFTIQAGARHTPIHPQAPKMVSAGRNSRVFAEGSEHLYRRLSVRECARIQTFPDSYVFKYENIADGYKMVGNAVPVNLAFYLADAVRKGIG